MSMHQREEELFCQCVYSAENRFRDSFLDAVVNNMQWSLIILIISLACQLRSSIPTLSRNLPCVLCYFCLGPSMLMVRRAAEYRS